MCLARDGIGGCSRQPDDQGDRLIERLSQFPRPGRQENVETQLQVLLDLPTGKWIGWQGRQV